MSNIQILVVEDDASINSLIANALTGAGYSPQSAYSGSEAALMLDRAPWKCVILDLMLPGISGEDLIAAIRERECMPVIVLSAKAGKKSKLELLSLGADDYMTKPFDIDELLARVAAQLRRFTVYSDSGREKTLRHMDIEMSMETRSVNVGGVAVHLTRREFDILEILMRHPQKVYSRANIYESVWDEDFIGDEKTVNVHISNLRAKLNSVSENSHIKTIWGVGFRLLG
jgi:DNA-binding response OmpR family regulator